MKLSFKVQTQHLLPAQYGALVQYLLDKDKFQTLDSIKISEDGVYVELHIPDDVALSEVDKDVKKEFSSIRREINAIANLEPMPCLCGCGSFLTVGACLNQSGKLVQGGLMPNEQALIRSGDLIGAIKAHRIRTGYGLKDSKDVCDRWRDNFMTADERNRAFRPF